MSHVTSHKNSPKNLSFACKITKFDSKSVTDEVLGKNLAKNSPCLIVLDADGTKFIFLLTKSS